MCDVIDRSLSRIRPRSRTSFFGCTELLSVIGAEMPMQTMFGYQVLWLRCYTPSLSGYTLLSLRLHAESLRLHAESLRLQTEFLRSHSESLRLQPETTHRCS